MYQCMYQYLNVKYMHKYIYIYMYIYNIYIYKSIHCNSFKSLAYIRSAARLRWIKMGSVNTNNYANGIALTHLSIVEKHFKTKDLLDWAKKKYSGGSLSSFVKYLCH